MNELYGQNNDLVGWIKIDGTDINYPVMQTKDDEEYYLHRNFYKEYSSYGAPFISASYDKAKSENMIVYGHHMNNMKMFGELENYKSEDFYNEHKFIKFYTLEGAEEYEIFAVFRETLYKENTFKYYQKVELNTNDVHENFVSECMKRSFYDTVVKASYGEKLITLTTCEYTEENSRLVVVGSNPTKLIV